MKESDLQPGCLYHHIKTGGVYRLISADCLSKHALGEWTVSVIYQSVQGHPELYCRDAATFMASFAVFTKEPAP